MLLGHNNILKWYKTKTILKILACLSIRLNLKSTYTQLLLMYEMKQHILNCGHREYHSYKVTIHKFLLRFDKDINSRYMLCASCIFRGNFRSLSQWIQMREILTIQPNKFCKEIVFKLVSSVTGVVYCSSPDTFAALETYPAPTLIEHPSDTTVIEDEPVTLNCKAAFESQLYNYFAQSVTKNEPKISIQWFHNGKLGTECEMSYLHGKYPNLFLSLYFNVILHEFPNL